MSARWTARWQAFEQKRRIFARAGGWYLIRRHPGRAHLTATRSPLRLATRHLPPARLTAVLTVSRLTPNASPTLRRVAPGFW